MNRDIMRLAFLVGFLFGVIVTIAVLAAALWFGPMSHLNGQSNKFHNPLPYQQIVLEG
jgi:hypothetical protein